MMARRPTSRDSPSCRTSNAAREFRPAEARAAGCGPTRRSRGSGPSSTLPSTTMPPPTAGAEDDAEHRAVAGAGAVRGLRQGEAVGVILHAHLASEQRGDVAVQRVAVERDGIGILHPPVAGLITPGMPIPTVAVKPSCASASRTRVAIASSVAG